MEEPAVVGGGGLLGVGDEGGVGAGGVGGAGAVGEGGPGAGVGAALELIGAVGEGPVERNEVAARGEEDLGAGEGAALLDLGKDGGAGADGAGVVGVVATGGGALPA